MADLVLEFFDLFTLELDDLFAVLADDVIVAGMMSVVGIVEFVVLAEVHFAQQPAIGQERQSAIDGRARNRFVPPARPCEKLFGGEMLVGAESGLDDGLALG